jgi:hypothetical protein
VQQVVVAQDQKPFEKTPNILSPSNFHPRKILNNVFLLFVAILTAVF